MVGLHRHSRVLANLIIINHYNLTRFERFNKVKALQVLLRTMAHLILWISVVLEYCAAAMSDSGSRH
jgi:hypothetical protein